LRKVDARAAAPTTQGNMDNTEPAGPSSPARTPKARRVPPGWKAPGPPGSTRDVALEPDEELSWLLGDWRIIQRRNGHRWSLDDFVTAWVARDIGLAAAPTGLQSRLRHPCEGPREILDLGCGIGSVALMLGWCFPDARVTGVEAQDVSCRMAVRSVVANAAEDRFTIIHMDLRAAFEHRLTPGRYDLVSGTPPYFDDPHQTRSLAIQKGPCRFEERGGVADYLRALGLALTANGHAVICHASRHRARVLAAIADSGLALVRQLEVIPKVAREALIDVFVLARSRDPVATPPFLEQLVVRDRLDQWTPAFLAVRLAMGMPPRP